MSLKGYFGIGSETTFGNPVSIATFVPINSESMAADTGGLIPDDIRGHRYRKRAMEGPFAVDGDVEFNPGPEDGTGHILKWAFGSCSTLGTAATGAIDTYKHTFDTVDSLDSFTCHIGVGNTMNRRISGCKIDELSVSAAAGEMLTLTASVLGRKEDVKTTMATPTFGTLNPFTWSQGSVTFDGSLEANVESVELSFTNNVVDDFYVLDNTRYRKDMPEGRRELSGALDISFENDTYYQKFLGGGTVPQSSPSWGSVNLHFEGDTITGTHVYELELDMPKLRIDTSDISISDADRVVQSMDFDAFYDDDLGYDIQGILKNTIGTY